MIMALARLIIFIAAVVGFTILMLKIVRDNSKRRSEEINQLIDLGEFVYAGGSGKYYSIGLYQCLLPEQLEADWQEEFSFENISIKKRNCKGLR